MDKKEFTVSEVIDSIGISSHTWVVFVILGFAMIFDGYDFMIVNSTNLFVAHTFWPDNANPGALMGSLTTWGLLGMVLGGAVGGILSDKLGRKKTLIMAVMFYGFFTLPQAFANDLAFFAAFRLIAGFGVGSCIPIVTTVFSESMPSKQRGVFVTCGMAFMVVGWVLAGLIANPICNTPTPIIEGFCNQIDYVTADGGTATMYANWRLCYLIGGLPLVYGIILIFVMHETPHWYANAGMLDKACERLTQIEQATRGTSHVYDPALLVVPPRPEKTSPVVLFSNKYIVGTAAIWCTYFVGQFCVYGMNAWIPTWFVGVGYSQADSVMLQTWNNVAAIASNFTVGFVADRIGRKRNLAGSWLFCIVAIVLCSLFVAPNNMGLCIVLMLLFGFALNYAITAVQPLMPETYPTAIRNTGTSWCQAFARFGGSASSIVLGGIAGMAFFQNAAGGTNWSTVVLVLIVPFILGFVCTVLFVKETGGKTMDQLAAEEVDNPVKQNSGGLEFGIMMVVVAILAVLCIVCPLAIPGWSKMPIALPLMAIGLLLPFVYFFVFAGKELAARK
ncbi:MFS transporter [Adlercreutzia faecimuris]|uniref:MFS transporter n=1 Tax=Adlercreutzia faecimuris TaxID=2897341 RepID=A0ABS9WFB5_9ACTN|nr:MFS transporter [Adlercreutzia sp. JBNU-10]MCI2241172.1 MFS transporter [Adlercreutzia sp. JBNU-10]